MKKERALINYFRTRETVESKKNKEKNWDTIKNIAEQEYSIGRRKRKQIMLVSFVVAASLIGLIIFSNLFVLEAEIGGSRQNYMSMIELMTPDSSEVVLRRSQKEDISLSEHSLLIYDDLGNVKYDSKIIEDRDTAEEVQYDKLIVPKGKRMNLVLSDGTKLWVNSGSKVIYPTQFKGDFREIFAEGEIFLEVKQDKKKPFIVKTETFDVKVLGTSFNICAYKENKISPSVVLVEGKVNIKHVNGKTLELNPNELVNIEDSHLGVPKTVNATDYIAWTNSYLVLRSETLSTILERLYLMYGSEYEIDEKAKDLKISGKLNLRQNHNEIMKTLETIAPIEIIYGAEQKINIKYKQK